LSDQPTTVTAAAPAEAKVKGRTYFWGTGRRKTSVARVRIAPGNGKFLICNHPIEKYFFSPQTRMDIVSPLKATNTLGKFDIFVSVRGGGQTGQSGAILLGVARALVKADPSLEPALRDGKYLTRDAREVERKKPGRPGARKRFQFSKR
jgi:small subunit ribosomal protein S9